ncbi:MAG: lysophospholipase [Pseudomonadota bacterium]|jgi:alpha-beta hydrolase superfamily lysophospholipase|uniref:alpha/beta hydrolase n=1 Tax=unclassified Polaromonas TaxID=2638319 RepID=UPI000BCD94A5|nr:MULTISPECIES: alpha/beta hydrolase [unclassified Polaromonas]MDO9258668.1 lysophospholipase [Polaromonas sp.]OYY32941.1 MAG: alpha/beta hydrolase [Polaromonas sp. 35-63-35]OYZ16332.1 MAG: alpha/beta hydrolase [Polaromonas sp. 16-63-31]OYZ76375.1 MAG: alpha/beta hydrolase [Polaromonas sp. 24-63-21]OZA48966.1 MAG: alpha/beta hydrolase [Polaromonas sp. 17-63-33]
MDHPLLAPFTARDGENLAIYEWPMEAWQADNALPPRAVVLLVHGLGEHASRYDHVAQHLLDWGFAVRAYDQRGHGESGGERGGLSSETLLLEDLAEVVDDTRQRSLRLPRADGAAPADAPLPLILLGHSLGGLVAGRFVSLGLRPVDGLVMSSPALDPGLNAIQKLLLATLPAIAPNLRVNNGLKPEFISHDPQVVSKYLADPLVHAKISARLAKFIATAGPATVAAASTWRTPTLLMYAGADRLVNPAGSRAFAEAAASNGGAKVVTTRCFDELYHEIFNELDAAPVFASLKAWLDARF